MVKTAPFELAKYAATEPTTVSISTSGARSAASAKTDDNLRGAKISSCGGPAECKRHAVVTDPAEHVRTEGSVRSRTRPPSEFHLPVTHGTHGLVNVMVNEAPRRGSVLRATLLNKPR